MCIYGKVVREGKFMLLQEEKHFLFNGLFTSFNNVLSALFRKYSIEVAEKIPI